MLLGVLKYLFTLFQYVWGSGNNKQPAMMELVLVVLL